MVLREVVKCLVMTVAFEAGLTGGGPVPLPAPPSMHSYSSSDDAGIVRARSSGKITAMQIRCLSQSVVTECFVQVNRVVF